MVIAGIVSVVAVALCALGIRQASLRSARRDVDQVIEAGGAEATAPVLIWTLTRCGLRDKVGTALTEPAALTQDDVTRRLTEVIEGMSANERLAFEAAYEQDLQASKDLVAWHGQSEAIFGAAAAGSLDALIHSLGENPDWIGSLVEPLTSAVDLGALSAGMLLNSATRHSLSLLPEGLQDSIVDHVDGAVTAVAETVTGVVPDARALDLDDLSPQISQQLAGPRPRQDAGQIQHAKV